MKALHPSNEGPKSILDLFQWEQRAWKTDTPSRRVQIK